MMQQLATLGNHLVYPVQSEIPQVCALDKQLNDAETQRLMVLTLRKSGNTEFMRGFRKWRTMLIDIAVQMSLVWKTQGASINSNDRVTLITKFRQIYRQFEEVKLAEFGDEAAHLEISSIYYPVLILVGPAQPRVSEFTGRITQATPLEQ